MGYREPLFSNFELKKFDLENKIKSEPEMRKRFHLKDQLDAVHRDMDYEDRANRREPTRRY